MGQTVFRGDGHHKVDAKGRVSIPAGFRRVLEAGDPDWKPGDNPRFIIVYGGSDRHYLEIFTPEAMSGVDAKIQLKKRGSKERMMLEWLYTARATEGTVDETGRIVLPAKLRRKIGLEGEAYFVAAGDTFEIWNPDTYESERLSAIEAELAGMPEGFDISELLDADGDL